jgi:hypothetical protein
MRGKLLRWRAYPFLVIGLFPAAGLAADTLVMTVEVGEGQPLDPDEIRAAVAFEVGGKVIRAAAQDPRTSSDILIIDVDQGQAGMVFRSDGGETRRRSMVLPPSREEGLRLISWMAANLVRDQLSGLTPDRPRQPAEQVVAMGPETQAAKDPNAQDPLRPNPYFDEPLNNPFVKVDPPVEVNRANPPRDEALPAHQVTLSAFGGFALLRGWTADYQRVATTSPRLELEAQLALRRLAFGVAVGLDSGMGQGGGGAIYTGYIQARHKLKLEVSAGLGFWTTGGSSSDAVPDPAGRLYAQSLMLESRGWIFARTQATVSYALYRWLDCSFRTSLNVGLFDLKDSSLAGLIGLRANR